MFRSSPRYTLTPRLIFIISVASSYSSVGLQKENADMDKDPSGWLPYRTFIEALKILTLGE